MRLTTSPLSKVAECTCPTRISHECFFVHTFAETLANEHPVTIYPGPPSPVRTKPAANRKVIGSTHDLTDQVLKLRINDDSSEGDDDGVMNVYEQENHANVITIGVDTNGERILLLLSPPPPTK